MKNRKNIYALVFALGLAFLSSCATYQGGSQSYKQIKTPEMEASFRQAEKLYGARKLPEAKQAYQDYLKQYPYNFFTPKTFFRLGEIDFHDGNYAQAASYYKKSYERDVDLTWGAAAVYKEAVSYSRLGDSKKTFAALDRLPWSLADVKIRVHVGSLRVAIAKKANDALEEKRGYLELIDAYEGASDRDANLGDANEMVSQKAAKDEIQAWVQADDTDYSQIDRLKTWTKNFEGRTSGSYLTWKLARLSDQKGDYRSANEWARHYIQSYPKQDYVPQAQAMLAELQKRGIGEETKIPTGERAVVGVLLPLTGKYAVYGESILHGLECGAGIFTPCRGDLGVNLLVRDTQGSPQVAAKIVSEFAQNSNVRAVIGPLPQVEVDVSAAEAEKANLPMITLSQKPDVAKQGLYIFRNFLTVADQVASVVGYTCKEKHWKKFAILYPDTPTGQEYKKDFEDEVNHCGGKVVAQAGYGPDTKNFTEALRNLKSSGTQQSSDSAVNFEALFVPDIYRKIPEVVAALKFLEIPGVHLMGGAGWDNPGLLSAGAEGLEGSIFVDGFFEKSTNFATRDFSSTFESAYGMEPTLLEAYAYDTLRLLGEVLRDHPTSSRVELQDALAKKRNFSGVTGTISFDDDGDARRRLTVLTVEGGEIREVH